MSEAPLRGDEVVVPTRLREALVDWVREGGDERNLVRSLDRLLDHEGIPEGLPVASWWPCLEAVVRAAESRGQGWSDAVAARLEGWLRATLRCTRPDGSTVFGSGDRSAHRRRLAIALAGRMADPALMGLARLAFPARGEATSLPNGRPDPGLIKKDRPLAVLRTAWGRRGDLLAIDHRAPWEGCRLELLGAGQRLLGSSWEAPPSTSAQVVHTSDDPNAAVYEWSFRDGGRRIVRTAVLLRGRRLALLAEERHGGGAAGSMSLDLPPEIGASVASDRPLVRLRIGDRTVARIIPPGLSIGSEVGGSISVEGNRIVVTKDTGARRSWVPLLVSWDPLRDRRAPSWRTLTVAERSRACPPGVAFAARVAWGRGEGLVVYRSLARPALRSFLGHQTRARFLVGVFTRGGEVLPLVKIDE